MASFTLIPGGWQGGWVYQEVADRLAAHGHHAVPITLSGLGDAPAPMANLERISARSFVPCSRSATTWSLLANPMAG